MNTGYTAIRKVIDWITALVLFVIFFPFFLLIIILYVLSGQHPVFFTQRRIGIHNRIFKLYKFRTLKNIDAPLQHRKFWLGNFLRYTSFDELPQVINILKGEMALVGPRPLPEEYLELFSEEQRKRHDVLPGITGLAQVSGRHALSWNEKFKFDIYYVSHISFVLDLTILVRTIILIFSFRKDVSLEEKKFTGKKDA